MDLVSVFCINGEYIEMCNSQDIGVLQQNIDIGPNNVDNLASLSYSAFRETFTVFGLSTVNLVYYYYFLSTKKKHTVGLINCFVKFHSHMPPSKL